MVKKEGEKGLKRGVKICKKYAYEGDNLSDEKEEEKQNEDKKGRVKTKTRVGSKHKRNWEDNWQ